MGLFKHVNDWLIARKSLIKIAQVVLENQSTDWPRPVKRNERALIQQYVGWVYKCSSMNARSVASVPLRLYAITRNGEPRPNLSYRQVTDQVITDFKLRGSFINRKIAQAYSVVEVVDHPFIDMMAQANPIMDGFELIELTILYQELLGDAYLLKIKDSMGTLRQSWPLLAQHVKILPDPARFVKGYEYGQGITKVTFDADEVSHHRYVNPEDYYYGKSPLQAASASVILQEDMEGYESALFRNRARPDQVLVASEPIAKTARKAAEVEFNRTLRGVAKSGKTVMLPYGVDLKQLSFSPKELSYLLGRKTTRDDVASIFDIPAVMLTPDAGNRSKDEAAEYLHAKYGIFPRCRRTEQRFNQDFISEYDDRLFCAFDDPVPEDKEFRLEEQTAHLRTGYSSINEERGLSGLNPTDWGDEPILPANMTPLSTHTGDDTTAGGAENDPLDRTRPGRRKKADGDDSKDRDSTTRKRDRQRD